MFVPSAAVVWEKNRPSSVLQNIRKPSKKDYPVEMKKKIEEDARWGWKKKKTREILPGTVEMITPFDRNNCVKRSLHDCGRGTSTAGCLTYFEFLYTEKSLIPAGTKTSHMPQEVCARCIDRPGASAGAVHRNRRYSIYTSLGDSARAIEGHRR